MGNQSVNPREVAQMIVDRCLKRALAATQVDANDRLAPSCGGMLISKRDLESIANWLGMKPHGGKPPLDDVFQFVQSTLEGADRNLTQGAPRLTIALDHQSPCITFAIAA